MRNNHALSASRCEVRCVGILLCLGGVLIIGRWEGDSEFRWKEGASLIFLAFLLFLVST